MGKLSVALSALHWEAETILLSSLRISSGIFDEILTDFAFPSLVI
jgi:hypothetical protein